MLKNFERLLENPLTIKLFIVVAGLILIGFLVKIVRNRLSEYYKDTDVRYRAKKMVAFAGYLLVFLFITIVFSDKLGKLTVAFGVIGAGVAFALQEVIISIAGWLALSFGQSYRVGDRIRISGITGDVIDIGVLRTTLMECGYWVHADQYNGRIVKVSNGSLFKEPVFNYSMDFPFLWDEIVLPIKYGSDFEETRRILLESAYEVVGDYIKYASSHWHTMVRKYMIEDAQVEPMVAIAANENWVAFTLRYVVDYKMRRSTRDKLFSTALRKIASAEDKVSIASSSLDVNLFKRD